MDRAQTIRDCGILFLLCLVMFFFGSGSLPITDPTESNYVLTAKEMLESGDYLSPHIYGKDWYDKPILFYWELIAAFRVMGISEDSARFFPALFAVLGIWGTYFFGRYLYDRKHGLTAAAILIFSVEYWYIAHAVITDMTLFCAMSAALIFFYLGYSGRKPKYYYAAYAAAGIAVLTKGPIGLAMPGFIILVFLAWQRDLSHLLRMRLGSGMALFFAIISVWYLPMFFLHGWDFIHTFFGVHNVLRATVSEHPEVNYWFYYPLVFLAGFLPWIVPLLIQGVRTLRKGRRRFPPLAERERFLLVWAVAVPAVFQCFETKYVTYTFPYMMPIAILFANYFTRHELLFRRMALGSLIVFPMLLFFVAAPLCEQSSAKRAAEEVLQLADDETCIAVYRKTYPASLTFYSGREVLRLETQKEAERLRPQGMQWNSLNVMPFLVWEDIPEDRPVLVIVGREKEESFRELARDGGWEPVRELPKHKIYFRDRLR